MTRLPRHRVAAAAVAVAVIATLAAPGPAGARGPVAQPPTPTPPGWLLAPGRDTGPAAQPATGVPVFIGTVTGAGEAPLLVSSPADVAAALPGASAALADAVTVFLDTAGDGAVAWVLPATGPTAAELTAAAERIGAGVAPDLIVVPELGALSAPDHLSVATAAVAAAERAQAVALLDPPQIIIDALLAVPGTATPLVELAQTLRATVPAPDRAALYSSPLDMAGGPELPGAVAAAAVIHQSDAQAGVWNAPAGAGHVLPGDPVVSLDDSEAGAVAVEGVNPLRTIVGFGNFIWGARTLAPGEASFLQVRRLLDTVSRTIELVLEGYVFEANDVSTWIAVDQATTDYLAELWQAGGLMGDTAEQAFGVSVGLPGTMTQEDVALGILRLEVQVAPIYPAEFLTLDFTQQLATAG